MMDINPYDELNTTEIEVAPLLFKAWAAAEASDYKTAYEYQIQISRIYEAAFRDMCADYPAVSS